MSSESFLKKAKDTFKSAMTGEIDLSDFDPYARDCGDFSYLDEFMDGLVIYSAGGTFPFQVEGLLKDFRFHFRYEFGQGELRVLGDEGNLYSYEDALYVGNHDGEETEDDYSEGDLRDERWISSLLNCFENLEKTKKRYWFHANAIEFDSGEISEDGSFERVNLIKNADGDPILDPIATWGHTEDEAFEEALALQDRMVGRLMSVSDPFSEKDVELFRKLLDLRKEVISVDGKDRVYPSGTQDFKVRVPSSWRDERGEIVVPVRN